MQPSSRSLPGLACLLLLLVQGPSKGQDGGPVATEKATPDADFLDFSARKSGVKVQGLQGADIIVGTVADDVLSGDLKKGDKDAVDTGDVLVGGDGDDTIYAGSEKPAKGQFDLEDYTKAFDAFQAAYADYQMERALYVTGHMAGTSEGRVDDDRKAEWEEAEKNAREQFGRSANYKGKGKLEGPIVAMWKARAEKESYDIFRQQEPDIVLAGPGIDTVYLGPGDGSIVHLGSEKEPARAPSKPKILDGLEAKLKGMRVQEVHFGPGHAVAIIDLDFSGVYRFVNYDPERHRIGVLNASAASGYQASSNADEIVFMGERSRREGKFLAHTEGRSVSIVLTDPRQVDARYEMAMQEGSVSVMGVPFDHLEGPRRAVSQTIAFLKDTDVAELLGGERYVLDATPSPGAKPGDEEQKARAVVLEHTRNLGQRAVAALGALAYLGVVPEPPAEPEPPGESGE